MFLFINYFETELRRRHQQRQQQQLEHAPIFASNATRELPNRLAKRVSFLNFSITIFRSNDANAAAVAAAMAQTKVYKKNILCMKINDLGVVSSANCASISKTMPRNASLNEEFLIWNYIHMCIPCDVTILSRKKFKFIKIICKPFDYGNW